MCDFVKSPLNYTGGKTRLLPQILPLFPSKIDTFVDLFCGGANVGINIDADHIVYNDYNGSVIGLLELFSKYDYDTISGEVEKIIKRYGLSESSTYRYKHYGCESRDGLCSFNKLPYLDLRRDFNALTDKDDKYYYMLFSLIIFAFNNQIRFNSKGEFNLPVGKRDFNKNMRGNLRRFIEALHKQDRTFCAGDFRSFDTAILKSGDFVYCDPPYLITTASYNESNGWVLDDEKDLLDFLDGLDSRNIKFALSNVTRHKGRTNDLLIEWSKDYTTHNLSFNYSNSSYHGNNRNELTEEVLITNY